MLIVGISQRDFLPEQQTRPPCRSFVHPGRARPPRVQAFLSDSSITSSFLGDSTSIAGGEPSIGYLFLNVNLGRFSLTKLSDDNPIDMLDFIANIGGFWGE